MKYLLKKISKGIGLIRKGRSPKPVANKLDRVFSLRSLGVPIDSVVDVGVQASTYELIKSVPDKHHHLFEPVNLWYPSIQSNYLKISHTLYPVALSNQNGEAWLIQSSRDGNGISTHANIATAPVIADGKNIVECTPIQVQRLDMYAEKFGKNFLLKVDVDGKELDVISGASGCIRQASVVIIEAVYSSIADRAKAVEQSGFQLIDIVDRVMYGEVLWQCDLVFLRNDLMNVHIRPPLFEEQHWHELP